MASRGAQLVQASIVTALDEYPYIKGYYPFNVTIIDLTFNCADDLGASYELGSPAQSYQATYLEPEDYGTKFIEKLTLNSEPIINDNDGKVAESEMITYSDETGNFIVEGYDLGSIGTWHVG